MSGVIGFLGTLHVAPRSTAPLFQPRPPPNARDLHTYLLQHGIALALGQKTYRHTHGIWASQRKPVLPGRMERERDRETGAPCYVAQREELAGLIGRMAGVGSMASHGMSCCCHTASGKAYGCTGYAPCTSGGSKYALDTRCIYSILDELPDGFPVPVRSFVCLLSPTTLNGPRKDADAWTVQVHGISTRTYLQLFS